MAALSAVASENGVIVSFEDGEGGIQHFPARHDDDVEAGGDLMAPEHLSGEAFGAVAFDGGPEFPCGRHTKPRRGAAIRQHEKGHEPAVDASAFIVDALEFGPAADALEKLRKDLPSARVVVLSTYDNPTYVARAVALGAADYVLKGSTRHELIAAVSAAAGGKDPSGGWSRS